ncbi:MAG: cytochrome c3 family protein [Pseudomonadota bacterium]
MKNRFLTLLVVVLTGMIFLSAGILTAADEPKKEVLIQGKGYEKDKKGPVKLTHEKHSKDYKVACADCHHVYKDGKNVWKQGDPVDKCSKCHDPKAKEGEAMKLQNAFHKNCKDCHKALAEANKPTGPFKKCNDCHQKK